MAEVIWTQSAKSDLIQIGDYIALDKPRAAAKLVSNIMDSVALLGQFPESGRYPSELPSGAIRELIIPPCRVFYRYSQQTVFILHIMREEQQFRRYMLGLE